MGYKQKGVAMHFGVWLACFVVFIIVEIATQGLVSAWFAVGSLAAAATSYLGGGIVAQITVFAFSTTVVLVLLRPLAATFLNAKDIEKTNVSAVVGKDAIVKTKIDNINASGLVEIDGVSWTARSEGGEIIPEGKIVEVIRVEGVKVFVKEK